MTNATILCHSNQDCHWPLGMCLSTKQCFCLSGQIFLYVDPDSNCAWREDVSMDERDLGWLTFYQLWRISELSTYYLLFCSFIIKLYLLSRYSNRSWLSLDKIIVGSFAGTSLLYGISMSFLEAKSSPCTLYYYAMVYIFGVYVFFLGWILCIYHFVLLTASFIWRLVDRMRILLKSIALSTLVVLASGLYIPYLIMLFQGSLDMNDCGMAANNILHGGVLHQIMTFFRLFGTWLIVFCLVVCPLCIFFKFRNHPPLVIKKFSWIWIGLFVEALLLLYPTSLLSMSAHAVFEGEDPMSFSNATLTADEIITFVSFVFQSIWLLFAINHNPNLSNLTSPRHYKTQKTIVEREKLRSLSKNQSNASTPLLSESSTDSSSSSNKKRMHSYDSTPLTTISSSSSDTDLGDVIFL
mmetsp:Transcript_9480/g.14308  ORF Transcript_9480/g.14308 Transcript_9480/m.14308 type:complete len:410 (+) Transcript_9480:102-1331(+)